MPRFKFRAVVILALGLAVAFPQVSRGVPLPNIVFGDDFLSSTLNSPTNSPTSTSTNYDIACNKNLSSSINTGTLALAMPATHEGTAEAEALFTSSPINLTNIGDEVELTVAFTDANNLNVGASTTAIYFGLFNSGGSAPDDDLQDEGLTSTNTNDATNGVADWQGYAGQVNGPTGLVNHQIVSRPTQNGSSPNNSDQDLLTDLGSESTQGYDNPQGDVIASGSPPGVALTDGNEYNEDLLIELTGANTYTITSNLYAGSSDSGTPIDTLGGSNISSTDFLTTSFDGLAFGWRINTSNETTKVASEMDINSVAVSTTVPEPATGSLLLIGGAGALLRRRRNKLASIKKSETAQSKSNHISN